jgi:hypothetical protein
MSTPLAAPITVRNTQPGPTVFTAPGNGAHVEWQGAGDPQGLDIQSCPAEFLQIVAFRNAMEKGIFEQVDDEAQIEEALTLHRQEWEQQQERRRNAGTDSIEVEANKDMHVFECIGLVGKGGQSCGAPLSLKPEELQNTPPLCSEHKKFARKYIAEETGKIINGKPEVRWTLPTMGARERQQ